MAIRGLIIAIESYAKIQGFGGELPGTTAAGVAFRQWLLQEKQAAPGDVLFCTEDAAAEGRTSGAKASEIIDALAELYAQSKDDTEQLYVFFSGHGFVFQEDPRKRAADVLLAADFTSVGDPTAGRRGIKLDEVQTKLQMAMGSGDHFYFIDACRNKVNEIDVAGTGLTLGRSVTGDPTVYTLYSTNRGAAAFLNSNFSQHLLAGLRGAGRAKVWRPDGEMEVTHASLRDYVREKLAGQETDARVDGDGRGLILEIKAAPTYACTLEVDGAAEEDEFTLALADSRGRPIGGAQTFKGPKFSFSQSPDFYRLRITQQGAPLVPAERTIDLWDACSVRFSMPGTLVQESVIEAPPMMLPGTLPVEEPPPSPVREAIVSRLPPYAIDGSRVSLSESLGWITDDDLGLWLAIAGASRIVRDPDSFSKLRNLPLERFEDVQPGGSAVYVLAGRDDLIGLRAAVGPARLAQWIFSQEVVPGVSGFRHLRIAAQPGPLVLSLAAPDESPITFVSHCLPGRVTLVVATGSATRGGFRIQQLLLPLAHLAAAPETGNPLEVVKRSSLAQRQFARKREVGALPSEDLLDPVTGLVAGYEALRRGRRQEAEVCIGKLRALYPGLPDIEALARLSGQPFVRPASPPMILDGLLAFEDYPALLPPDLPEDRLDYSGPWTAWRRAVK
ncbi:MAG TPA: caspase family protein [Thermoanaerobaculia bacterium]|nr:caspase family protein [Thermoanaerobaculia bacterium]